MLSQAKHLFSDKSTVTQMDWALGSYFGRYVWRSNTRSYFYVKLEKMAKGRACVTIVFNYIHTKSNDQCLAAKSLNYSTIVGKWYAG